MSLESEVANLTAQTTALLTAVNVQKSALDNAAAQATSAAAQVGGVQRTTASGTVTLTVSSPTYQFIDPNGANRDVVLPAPGAEQTCMFAVKHTGGANSLTVKTAALVALDLPVMPGYTLALVWGGTAWEVL